MAARADGLDDALRATFAESNNVGRTRIFNVVCSRTVAGFTAHPFVGTKCCCGAGFGPAKRIGCRMAAYTVWIVQLFTFEGAHGCGVGRVCPFGVGFLVAGNTGLRACGWALWKGEQRLGRLALSNGHDLFSEYLITQSRGCKVVNVWEPFLN